ncbi:BMC domain-containing protein [Streptococcus sp. S784/96/1]|uniref:BMC domain-containing protein n=1 Tax=Streptococcus sp. S784/96/1 TaxID=2653499 RepID=UPI001386F203|nr:BMC domain-containing protein [Streptococcus sp. S784/96/1]
MERYQAIGAVETFGLVYALEAADAMVKASDVEVIAYVNTASGYIAVIVQGETAACKTAVDAGVSAVEKMGTEVYSSVVIPGPHEDLKKIIDRYSLEMMFPEEVTE